ncbi:hypothetical protein BC941DRAFT_435206 [Chlamydoabsidia padenii]|nr:hypothetical protein BC941DRAFT_435206 [Chlamydoabsidia padenii]
MRDLNYIKPHLQWWVTLLFHQKLSMDNKLAVETSGNVKVILMFNVIGSKEDLLYGIYAYNFKTPSAILKRAIVPITTSPLSRPIDTVGRETQAISISPTYELATKIHSVALDLNVHCHAFIGGTNACFF